MLEANGRDQQSEDHEKQQEKEIEHRPRRGKKKKWYHKSLFGGHRSRFTWKFAWEVAKSLCVLWLVLLILSWNLGNLGVSQFATPSSLRPLARGLHLDQSWNMFSPRPPDVDWWYIIQVRYYRLHTSHICLLLLLLLLGMVGEWHRNRNAQKRRDVEVGRSATGR